jgi:hypothetical protein
MADFDLVIRVGTAVTAVDVLLTDVGIPSVCSTAIDYSRKLIRCWGAFSDLHRVPPMLGRVEGFGALA